MKVRIKDIARLAQVSAGTVDRVLHNRGEVSEKTRKKIEEIIQELNYQPDILAKTLSSKRELFFAVLMPVSVNEDFWSAPRKGIEKAISEIAHFGITINYYLFDQNDRTSFEQQCESLFPDNPDAVLFAPVFPNESSGFLKTCRKYEIPVILFNSNLEDMNDAVYIGQDSIKSGEVAARLMWYSLNNGDRIIVANPAARKENHNHLIRRERGFRKFFAEHDDKQIDIITLNNEGENEKQFFQKFKEIAGQPRLKGIFVTNSRVHMIARFMRELDLTHKLLIGFDLLPVNTELMKKGAIDFIISQKPEEQGYRGIMTLYHKIFLAKEIPKEQFIPIDIITRENIDFYEYR